MGDGNAPRRDGRYPDGSRHHVPSTCWRCDGPAEKHEPLAGCWSPGVNEPYWFCRRCGQAQVCACLGCETMRALARLLP